MDSRRIERLGALLVAAGTFGSLFAAQDGWSTDNLFLVPDLLLCAGLVWAAASGDRASLLIAFGASVGVLSCAVASYAVDGRFGVASLVGALVALALAVRLSSRT